MSGDKHALPGHTVLLTGIDAEPREVEVLSACSLDYQMYQDHLESPGLFNMQLKVCDEDVILAVALSSHVTWWNLFPLFGGDGGVISPLLTK